MEPCQGRGIKCGTRVSRLVCVRIGCLAKSLHLVVLSTVHASATYGKRVAGGCGSLSLSLSYSSVERAFFLWAGEKERDVGAEEETQGLGSKAGSRDGNTRARERRERILSSSSVARRRRRNCRPQSSLSISLRSLASLTQSVVGYLRSWKK